ncbi:MAG TPA: hypothetical protein VEC16_01335 [Alphaproteobacteria bacterium]|nr:hypothetical protein [Alphaproteobacteria bacterium]
MFKCEGRWARLFLVIFTIIVISSGLVIAPPPIPPVPPQEPPVEPSCSATNEGIEICDSLDNDCDGFIDEEGCSPSVPQEDDTTADSTGSTSGTSTDSKKGGGGGGGGSGGGSSGILFFSEPESSGTVVDKSSLPADDSSSGVDKTTPEYFESLGAQVTIGSSSTEGNTGSQQDSSSESKINNSYAAVLFNDYRNMIIGSTALLLIAGVIIFIVVRNNGFKKNPVPTDKQGLTAQEAAAVKYIQQMRVNKYSENDIRASMKKSGWDDKEIDKLTRK